MLTEEELVELCHQHELSDFAIAVVRRVRESDPSRNVSSGTKNVATHYASRKMGQVIKAEARRTELAALYEWDHDKATHEFYDQPPMIKKIHDRGEGRTSATRYTPDFFILSDEFIGWVECKAESWLLEREKTPNPDYLRDENGVWRCPSAEAYANGEGLGFRVRSSRESDPIVTQNIADLSDYYDPSCPATTPEQLQIAWKLMGDAGWCWLRDLITSNDALNADTVFKMIVDELLHVNLHEFTLMNEPERVRVFRTKALMDSSSLWLPSLLDTSSATAQAISLNPGAVVFWDGKACELLNIGDTEVMMRRPEGVLQTLTCDEFDRLVTQGQIIGNCVVADPRMTMASERLRRATTEDIEAAKRRYYAIHPEMVPPESRCKTPGRSLRKYKALARRGMSEYGNEFIGLLPTISLRGNRKRKIEPAVLTIMQEEILSSAGVKSNAAKQLYTCWSVMVSKCRENGCEPPSRKAFDAEIRRLMTPEEFKKARQGEKAGYDLEIPYLSLDRDTPKHGCRAFDLAHIDHTELDLQMVDESNGTNMGKAWLTVLIDAFTRVILAWVILFDEPSYRSCMLVARDCVRRHGRFPKTVVSDQGPEFGSKYYETMLAHMASHKRMRPKSKPRFGNIVERFFGINNTQFTHALVGNNQALQSPRSMSHTHDPRAVTVWNLRAFRESFDRFLTEVYHAVEHPALGVSPAKALEISLLQSGTRSHIRIPYTREFVITTLPSNKQGDTKIQKNASFKVNRIEYFSEQLTSYAGQSMEVRYDPYDVGHAYVMGKSGWIEGRSMYEAQLAGRSEKEITAISLQVNEINSRSYIRDTDRAQAVGDFLRGIRDVEANLAIQTQAARDRELHASDEGNGLLVVPPETPSNVVPLAQQSARKADTRARQKTDFENMPRRTFGEF
ncbi:DDE-type integrase/transposase/recombinase [Rhodoferax sp. 4810]|nr:DDE-type integrase/transposase/recombinase [Rhodoferax jenense]